MTNQNNNPTEASQTYRFFGNRSILRLSNSAQIQLHTIDVVGKHRAHHHSVQYLNFRSPSAQRESTNQLGHTENHIQSHFDNRRLPHPQSHYNNNVTEFNCPHPLCTSRSSHHTKRPIPTHYVLSPKPSCALLSVVKYLGDFFVASDGQARSKQNLCECQIFHLTVTIRESLFSTLPYLLKALLLRTYLIR